jgi:hypothetical protein
LWGTMFPEQGLERNAPNPSVLAIGRSAPSMYFLVVAWKCFFRAEAVTYSRSFLLSSRLQLCKHVTAYMQWSSSGNGILNTVKQQMTPDKGRSCCQRRFEICPTWQGSLFNLESLSKLAEVSFESIPWQ